MSDDLISIDEFLSKRKDFVKNGDILLKANRAASSWDATKRSMRFTMSAEVEDRDRDIVYQAGLNIDEFVKNPVGFYNHRSYGRPHGTWSDLEKILSGRPKRTEGTFTVAPEGVNPDADALALDMGAGLIKASSIGFRPKAVKKRAVPEDKRDAPYYYPGYDILEAELLECSVVSIPANPAALAKSAANGSAIAREMIEDVLDNWAKHPETGLLIPRSEFEAAHKDATGNRTVSVVLNVDSSKAQEIVHALSAVAKKTGDDDPPPADKEKSANDADAAKTFRANQVVSGTIEGVGPVVDGKQSVHVPTVADEKPLTTEQKDSLLTRLFKWFGSRSDEDIARELEAIQQQRLAEAEAAAQNAASKAAEREQLQSKFQSLQTRLESKGLV